MKKQMTPLEIDDIMEQLVLIARRLDRGLIDDKEAARRVANVLGVEIVGSDYVSPSSF